MSVFNPRGLLDSSTTAKSPMRSLASSASMAAPAIKTLAPEITIRNKVPRSAEVKSRVNGDQTGIVSSSGNVEIKDSSFGAISIPHKSHSYSRDYVLNSKPIDNSYFAEILSRKDWCLLLNHEFKFRRLSLNAHVVVSVLQNQENVLCPLRFYVWLSGVSALLAKNFSIRSALSNALYRKGPVLLSAELVEGIRNSGCKVNEDLLCALIGSWGRLGLARYCSEVFEQVSFLGISPSTRLYNAVIDGLIKSNALDLAYLKFQQMEVDNCLRDRFTYNILIHGVCKAGVMDEAFRLFKQMEGFGCSANVYTYTILIDGYCNAKKVGDAFRILEEMKTKHIRPNDATYRSLVNGVFRALAPHEASDLLSHWVKRDPNLPKVVYDSVVYCLCNSNLPKHAAVFLRTSGEHGYVPDGSVSNLVMTCLIKGLHLEETCRIFDYFIRCGVKLNLTSCLSLVEALYISRREEKANLYICWLLDGGFITNVYSYNMVIDCFCKAKMMDRSIETLRLMSERGICPNVVTFNTLIAGYCRVRDVVNARKVLQMLFDNDLKPDVVTFSSIINVLCHISQMADAFACFMEMVEWGIPPNAVTYNSLIKSLCIHGDVVKATNLLRKMQMDGIQPDVYTFNALIQVYCKFNKFDKAQRLLKRMSALELHPDTFTYTAFINALCESGRLSEAKELFDSMEENGCRPDAYVCSCLIDAFVKSGRFNEAHSLWLKFKERVTLRPLAVQSSARVS